MFCTVYTVRTCLCGKTGVRESADELNLWHNPLTIGQDCGNLSCMFTRTSSNLPSIYIKPWAGGVSLRGLPLGVIGCDVPEVHPSGPGTRTHSCPRRSTKSALQRTKVTAVGTSTNCSASCGSKTVQCGMESCGILGTAMTCSGIAVSRSLRTSTSWSTICGTVTSRSRQAAPRRAAEPALAGPRGWTRPVGRVPHTASSSSNSEKNAVSPATLVFDVQCVASVVLAVSCPHSSLNFGGNGAEEWWKVSARTMRTVCRSCFSHERSRRSRRLLAAKLARSTSDMTTAEV